MRTEEEPTLADLARNLTRGRDLARRLSMPFVSRLLDLSLLELAMICQGREDAPSSRDALEELLQLKLQISLLERGSETHLRRT